MIVLQSDIEPRRQDYLVHLFYLIYFLLDYCPVKLLKIGKCEKKSFERC